MTKSKKSKGQKSKASNEIDKQTKDKLMEVDKTFLELQIADLNGKVARLRQEKSSLQSKHLEAKSAMEQLDMDRGDMIAYLNKSLTSRTEEVNELRDRLLAIEKEKNSEMERYEQQIQKMLDDYVSMKDELTSEVKLYVGKLQSLEEFRAQQDELMKKFERQENFIQQLKNEHENKLYEVEKSVLINKHKLKKDMEEHVTRLANDFQEANELRTSATTHQMVRENISINNELELMVTMLRRLTEDNERLKKRDKKIRIRCTIVEDEKKILQKRTNNQKRMIKTLTGKYFSMKKDIVRLIEVEKKVELYSMEHRNHQREKEELTESISKLKKQLDVTLIKKKTLEVTLKSVSADKKRLAHILKQSAKIILDSIGMEDKNDEQEILKSRDSLLNSLMALLTSAELFSPASTSSTMINIYQMGDVGFVPKPKQTFKNWLLQDAKVIFDADSDQPSSYTPSILDAQSIVNEVAATPALCTRSPDDKYRTSNSERNLIDFDDNSVGTSLKENDSTNFQQTIVLSLNKMYENIANILTKVQQGQPPIVESKASDVTIKTLLSETSNLIVSIQDSIFTKSVTFVEDLNRDDYFTSPTNSKTNSTVS